MVDVGGQRSQRQKWFQCFDGITSILFMVSSSEYDQVLMEDRRTNRLVESMNIFETIVNNKLFFNVSIILFLNKMDLLVEKVKTVSIKKYFSDFKGDPHRLEDVQRYLVQCFDRKRRNRSKPLFHHFTTAIDTENIRFVFHAVKDTILQENLKDIMLQWRRAAPALLEFRWRVPSKFLILSLWPLRRRGARANSLAQECCTLASPNRGALGRRSRVDVSYWIIWTKTLLKPGPGRFCTEFGTLNDTTTVCLLGEQKSLTNHGWKTRFQWTRSFFRH